MPAIQMRCPLCKQTVDVPEELVDEGHKCYKCNVPVEIASKAVAVHRERARAGEYRGPVIGACVGAVLVPAFGAIGGSIGGAIAGAVVGATVGVVVGFVYGLFAGMEWSVLMWDSSWLTFWAKFWMVLGGIAGIVVGISDEVAPAHGEWPLLVVGAIGGMCLGGLLGVHLGRSSIPPVEEDKPTPST